MKPSDALASFETMPNGTALARAGLAHGAEQQTR
jgi:hypothetical protein